MAALIIRIEESHAPHDDNRDMVGFSVLDGYEGELKAGDVLPGIRPILLRAIHRAIDNIFGEPVSASDKSIEEAYKQSFIH